MDYLPVAEARSRPGLKLVLTAHLPAPWGEAAKAVFRARNLAFVAVAQEMLQPNAELVAWTGFRNAPVAVWEDDPAVAGWLEILMLAERLGSGPSLLPEDPIERALSLGLSTMIMGHEGFGWMRRLTMATPEATARYVQDKATAAVMRGYGLHEEASAAARPRLAKILAGLGRQLREQAGRGSAYFVGDRLTATDLHWACLSQMIAPLPAAECPMPDWMRDSYGASTPDLAEALDPILIRHRDRIWRDHIGLPVEF